MHLCVGQTEDLLIDLKRLHQLQAITDNSNLLDTMEDIVYQLIVDTYGIKNENSQCIEMVNDLLDSNDFVSVEMLITEAKKRNILEGPCNGKV